MMIYALAVGSQPASLETPIFLAIRFTILSLAINPFLYGLLAGQYRQAYAYVLRLLLSKCCPCVKRPEQSIHGMCYHC